MSEKKLVKKLAKVMDQVKYIEKKGYNKFHKYHYATESDVSEKVREVLAENDVIMLPDIVDHATREHINQRGNKEYIATVTVKFTFIDGETGEQLSIHGIGEGQDAGDKAVYKAITGATKYALMKTFMIPTGDDPEADSGVDERNQSNKNTNTLITPEQVGTLKTEALKMAKLHDMPLDEVFKKINVTNIEQLTKQQADTHINNLRKWMSE